MDRVERYCAPGREEFLRNELLQDGVLRNLHILSESSQRISESSQARCPGVDWRNLSGFRNVLVHDYLGIDLARVWSIVTTDLVALKSAITKLRAELDGLR